MLLITFYNELILIALMITLLKLFFMKFLNHVKLIILLLFQNLSYYPQSTSASIIIQITKILVYNGHIHNAMIMINFTKVKKD